MTIRFAGQDFEGPCPAALWMPAANGVTRRALERYLTNHYLPENLKL